VNTGDLHIAFIFHTQENRIAANIKKKHSNSTNQTNETAPPPSSRKSSAPRKPSTGNW
jgi:hypothetical protein